MVQAKRAKSTIVKKSKASKIVSKKKTNSKEKSTIVSSQKPERIEVSNTDFMTTREMYDLQSLTKTADVYKMKMAAQDQAVKNVILQQELIKYDLESAIRSQNKTAAEHVSTCKQAGAKIIELKNKYKVNGDFAYDPMSGKIIRGKQ